MGISPWAHCCFSSGFLSLESFYQKECRFLSGKTGALHINRGSILIKTTSPYKLSTLRPRFKSSICQGLCCDVIALISSLPHHSLTAPGCFHFHQSPSRTIPTRCLFPLGNNSCCSSLIYCFFMLSVLQLHSLPVFIAFTLSSSLVQLVWMVKLIGKGLQGPQAPPAVL